MAEKKKKPEAEEDLSTEQLQRIYRTKCDFNGVPICKIMRDRVEQAVADGVHILKIHLWEEMGPVGVRALMESLTQLSYKHLKSLRLWRVKAQDEGVRSICIYIDKVKLLEILDLMDNEIGLLGCQFLNKVLHPASGTKLTKLKLDHNEFGTKGLEILAQGLAQNDTIEKLSLNYCGITADGSKYIQQILGNLNTKLFKLKICGNLFKNEGAYEIFRALEINTVLEKIKISDNQFTLDSNDQKLINKIVDTMNNNTTLGYYDLKFNSMNDEAVQSFTTCVESNKNIYFIEVSDHVTQQLQDKLKLLVKKRKPKKKKKSKKKKSK